MKTRKTALLGPALILLGVAVGAPAQDRSSNSGGQPSGNEGSERFNRSDRDRSNSERFNNGDRSNSSSDRFNNSGRFNSGDRFNNTDRSTGNDRNSERSERFRSFRSDPSNSTTPSGTSAPPATSGGESTRSRFDFSRSDSSRSDRSESVRFDPNPEATRARYGDFAVLTERNVFLRDRRRPEPVRNASEGAPRPREESYVLRGFAIQDEVRVAFIENASTGETIKATAGTPVLQGLITSMDLDSLEFENNGTKVRVTIGSNLAGSTGASASTSPLSLSPSSSPPASAEDAAMMEKLRARRQQGR